MSWFWHHLDALRVTLARLARTPVVTLLNVGVIGIALALPVGCTWPWSTCRDWRIRSRPIPSCRCSSHWMPAAPTPTRSLHA